MRENGESLPEYMHVINDGMTFTTAVDCAIDVFKHKILQYGRNYNYVDIKKNKRYYGNFKNLVSRLCMIVHDANPNVRLGKLQYVKLLLDYYTSIFDFSCDRGRIFNINQIHTPFALDIFQQWCVENYITMDRYIEMVFVGDEERDANMEYSREVERTMKKMFRRMKSGGYELIF